MGLKEIGASGGKPSIEGSYGGSPSQDSTVNIGGYYPFHIKASIDGDSNWDYTYFRFTIDFSDGSSKTNEVVTTEGRRTWVQDKLVQMIQYNEIESINVDYLSDEHYRDHHFSIIYGTWQS